MNATMETILHRRSIRSFLEKPIPKPVLEEIVLAGQYAPSAMNRQNWHFTVLQNQQKIQSLAKTIAQTLGMGEEYCFYCPAALILVSAPKDSHNGIADCACALENIFLAAWSLEVGSVWINQLKDICDQPAVRAMLDELDVPGDHLVGGMAALGYYETAPEAKPRAEGTVTWVD